MKRGMAFFLLIGLLCTLLGCAREEKGVEVLLDEHMAKLEALPAGKIYRSGVEIGEMGYFSPHLMATMYGEEAETRCFSLVEEYALYLSSFAEPCEIAVFRCYARSDADRIAQMCLARIEQLRILLTGTPYRDRVDAATVSVNGRLVVMQIVP